MTSKTVSIIACVAAALAGGTWLGRHIAPRPFPAYPERSPELQTIPLPQGLPAPVERYYRTIYGDRIPLITSAVITGRATMRPAGPLAFPARYRFIFEAGQGYRHYIETTFFGIPFLKADEHFVDGKGKMEITLIGTDEGEKYDQAANLGLWAESSLFPAIYLTDPRAHWDAVDEATAILVVPFRDGQQRFVVRFDEQTGLIDWLESMRYKTSSSTSKVLWLNRWLANEVRDGKPVVSRGSVTWMDDGKPWFVLDIEDAVYNVDVQEYIREKGL